MRRMIVAAFFLAVASSGCATIINGQTELVHVETIPNGCRVTLDGSAAQTSPCSFPVKRASDHILRVEKEGFEPTTVTLSKSFSAVTLLDCLPPGWLIWWAVDFIDGSAWKMDQTAISTVLEPIGGAHSAAPMTTATPAPPQ